MPTSPCSHSGRRRSREAAHGIATVPAAGLLWSGPTGQLHPPLPEPFAHSAAHGPRLTPIQANPKRLRPRSAAPCGSGSRHGRGRVCTSHWVDSDVVRRRSNSDTELATAPLTSHSLTCTKCRFSNTYTHARHYFDKKQWDGIGATGICRRSATCCPTHLRRWRCPRRLSGPRGNSPSPP